jgi:hypothetical protein
LQTHTTGRYDGGDPLLPACHSSSDPAGLDVPRPLSGHPLLPIERSSESRRRRASQLGRALAALQNVIAAIKAPLEGQTFCRRTGSPIGITKKTSSEKLRAQWHGGDLASTGRLTWSDRYRQGRGNATEATSRVAAEAANLWREGPPLNGMVVAAIGVQNAVECYP